MPCLRTLEAPPSKKVTIIIVNEGQKALVFGLNKKTFMS